jgi:membrane protease YdiL (CAAX protease family)
MALDNSTMKMTKKRVWIELGLAAIWVWAALFGVIAFEKAVFPAWSLTLRMLTIIPLQWVAAIGPLVLCLIDWTTWEELGFSKSKIPLQILFGIGLALLFSLLFTLVPIWCGGKDLVGTTSYTEAYQFAFVFAQDILGVALAEEFIFRGFFFRRINQLTDKKWVCILASSLLFGLAHIYSLNWIQVVVTAFLGALFALAREKIPHTTTLSLILTHGIYDALIPLWLFLL